MSGDEFWRLSRPRFLALSHEWGAVEDIADMRVARLQATVANTVRGKNRRAYKPDDFFTPRARKRPKTPDQLLGMVEALNRHFGGKDLRPDGG